MTTMTTAASRVVAVRDGGRIYVLAVVGQAVRAATLASQATAPERIPSATPPPDGT